MRDRRYKRLILQIQLYMQEKQDLVKQDVLNTSIDLCIIFTFSITHLFWIFSFYRLLDKIKNHQICIWWRRWESNPRPDISALKLLRV